MWPLCGDIDVVSGIHSGRRETIRVSGRRRGNDGAQLSLSDERRQKKKSEQQQSHRNLPIKRYQDSRRLYAADFFCAAPRMARSLCATMISSPGLMVIETSSMWSGSLRSFRFGFGFPSRTALTRLG